VAAVIL